MLGLSFPLRHLSGALASSPARSPPLRHEGLEPANKDSNIAVVCVIFSRDLCCGLAFLCVCCEEAKEQRSGHHHVYLHDALRHAVRTCGAASVFL